MGCRDSKPIPPVDGEKQLQDAAKSGDFTKVKQLLIAGVPADQRSWGSSEWSPLHLAAAHGHSDIVKILLANGAIPELKEPFCGRTPLHFAAEGGDIACIQLLLNKGVDINCCNDLGFTPLHEAAREGRDVAIEYLLESGAFSSVTAKYGTTPLMTAARDGQVKAVKALLEGGCVDRDKNAAMHIAVEDGHTDVVDMLIENGADMDKPDACSDTPLQKAAFNGHFCVVAVLLGHGANVHIRAHDCYDYGTALHRAARRGHDKIVKLLLGYGASIEVEDVIKSRPLHEAAGAGKRSTVELLLSAGADMNAVDDEGRTPLALAIEKKREEVIDLLSKSSK